MGKKYINNLETGHIELHFEKSEYQALTDAEKREIKGAYLWSRYANAWVSRSTKNHYSALRVAEQLGFTEEEKQGQRLSFEEELQIKVEKAERRADKYEYKADKAIKEAENLQSSFNSYHGDISFWTQPNINSSRGRAFTRYRDKVINRYKQGMEEYRKSEYFKERAKTARYNADMEQFKNPVYLSNRISECNSNIRKLESNVVHYEDIIYKKENNQNDELYDFYKNKSITEIEEYLNETLEKMEYQIDKLAYLENALEEIGGNKFSKENIKVGYIVNMRRWGKCQITSTGPKNVQYMILTGGAKGLGGVEPYAAIVEILEAREIKSETKNSFSIGDILTRTNVSGNRILHAYQVIKTTAKTITIQEIEVKGNKPVKDSFISEKQERKTVKEDRQKNIVVNDGSWYLYKYCA